MKSWFLILFSICVIADPKLIEINPYKLQENDAVFNALIVINQIYKPLNEQPILGKIINKSDSRIGNFSYSSLLNDLHNNGYQIVLISYLERNELFNPVFSTTHLFIKYDIRSSKRRLNQERKIFSEAFQLLDNYVISEYYRRPLCVILHLPPKQKYQLEIKNKNDNRTFEEKRDFSLINLYHEIHKRRYLHPNKLLIYPHFSSKGVIIINNK